MDAMVLACPFCRAPRRFTDACPACRRAVPLPFLVQDALELAGLLQWPQSSDNRIARTHLGVGFVETDRGRVIALDDPATGGWLTGVVWEHAGMTVTSWGNGGCTMRVWGRLGGSHFSGETPGECAGQALVTMVRAGWNLTRGWP